MARETNTYDVCATTASRDAVLLILRACSRIRAFASSIEDPTAAVLLERARHAWADLEALAMRILGAGETMANEKERIGNQRGVAGRWTGAGARGARSSLTWSLGAKILTRGRQRGVGRAHPIFYVTPFGRSRPSDCSCGERRGTNNAATFKFI
jgi:hypothetical protein